jgi:hypothetical protein
MATRNEAYTRARAMLRETITNSDKAKYDSEALLEVLDCV